MAVLRLTVALMLLVSGMQASAEDIRPELEKCRAIDSLAYRLQCYDELVDDLNQSGISTVVPDAPAPAQQIVQPVARQPLPQANDAATNSSVAVTQPAPRDKKAEAEEFFGKTGDEVKEVVEKQFEINTVDEIASEVTQVRIAPNKEYVVYLANGQVWRQKDKIGKWRIKVGERAVISKAALGSYRMKSDQRKRSVRAERIR